MLERSILIVLTRSKQLVVAVVKEAGINEIAESKPKVEDKLDKEIKTVRDVHSGGTNGVTHR